MDLKTLLVSVGGIGVVVKLLVDVVKALTGLTGRATKTRQRRSGRLFWSV